MLTPPSKATQGPNAEKTKRNKIYEALLRLYAQHVLARRHTAVREHTRIHIQAMVE